MELIPENLLFQEISSFQKEDFENYWAEANPLSDQELDLFTSPPQQISPREMEFNFCLFENDPMLSTTMDSDDLVMRNAAADVETNFDLELPSPVGSYSSQPDTIYYSESEEEADHVSLDHDYGKVCEVKEEPVEYEEKPKRPTRPRRRQRRRRYQSQRSEDEDQEEEVVIFSNGKPKLYAERPFKNPQQERARLNAINAKKNRDRKKMESAGVKMEMEKLREQNDKMKKSLQRFEVRAAQAERELAAIKELLQLANLGDLLKLASGKKGQRHSP